MTASGALYYGQNAVITNIYMADLDDRLNLKGTPSRITDRAINANSRPGISPDGCISRITRREVTGGFS